MKKVLLGVLAVLTVFSLTACGKEKENTPTILPDDTQTVTQPEVIEQGEEIEAPTEVSEEEGNQESYATEEEAIVAHVLQDYFQEHFSEAVEKTVPTNIKIYTNEEITADPAIQEHNINEGDIVFDVTYDLKIKDDYEDIQSFTAATGEIDGQWVRNKSNLGIARNNGDAGYSLDAFGTGW